jgi:protein gp37
VSPGCGGAQGQGGCYAEKTAYRFSGPGMPYEGLVTMGAHGPRWTGKGLFVPEKLDEPLHVRRPIDGSRHRFFVNSMSDLFFEEFSNEQIAAGFGVMAACPQHDFLILTKRIRRALDWFAWYEGTSGAGASPNAAVMQAVQSVPGSADSSRHWYERGKDRPWPLPNVWLGVSVEDQKAADERIPDLLRCPAAIRFISAEPLLGPLDLRKYLNFGGICECPSDTKKSERCEGKGRKGWIRCNAAGRRLDWIIAGGESGPRSRTCSTAWLETIAKHAAQQLGFGTRPWPVPVFIKQLGANVVVGSPSVLGGVALTLKAKKGQRQAEWPESLRVQQYPETRNTTASPRVEEQHG